MPDIAAGDGFFASFDGPARAIRCVKSIIDNVEDMASRSEPAFTLEDAN